MIRIGILGYGYWGPRIVRNFHKIVGCEVAIVCDKNLEALSRAARDVRGVGLTSNPVRGLVKRPHRRGSRHHSGRHAF